MGVSQPTPGRGPYLPGCDGTFRSSVTGSRLKTIVISQSCIFIDRMQCKPQVSVGMTGNVLGADRQINN